jgi:hypothetical protein
MGFGLIGIQVTLLIEEDGPEGIEPAIGAFALLLFLSDQGPDPEALAVSPLGQGKDRPEDVVGPGLALLNAGKQGPEDEGDLIPGESFPECSAEGEKTAIKPAISGLAPEKGEKVHMLLFPLILMGRSVGRVKRNEAGQNAFRGLSIPAQRIEKLQFFGLVFLVLPKGKEGPKGPFFFLRAFNLRVKGTGSIQTANLFFRVGLDMKEGGDIFRGDILGKVNAAGSTEKANEKKGD